MLSGQRREVVIMEKNYLFSKDHIWIYQEDYTVKIGISSYAVEQLGNIMFLNLPEEGEKIEINERFGDIESVKTVSDLISPVTGEVVSVNEDLLENLENISNNPYESWFIVAKAEQFLERLMSKEEYQKYRDEL